jgi:hypothetical protein
MMDKAPRPCSKHASVGFQPLSRDSTPQRSDANRRRRMRKKAVAIEGDSERADGDDAT